MTAKRRPHQRPGGSTGGPSGKHSSPRRKLSAPAETYELWDHAAEASGQSWADWARRALSVAAAKDI